ncbi:putative quinol monooxygenase [Acrocarpospora catenulata]|uniref:putative quinol monooxygenase n=1 Tax=Acrocarpospora catenulata TaxID=2836182 RepID=UPI001BD98090|nr:antibiotic biosynthesis monooxygenase [Acrocarpospora catenulata]
MEVLVAVIAFAGALLAAITTGALIGRLRDEASGWLTAWSITTAALCLSLGAVAVGHLLGFGPLTFRVYQIGGALLAPVWLSVGLIQLLGEKRSARFAGWLLGGGLTLVGGVILVLDPVDGGFTKELPIGNKHWDLWPEWLLRGVHGLVGLILLISLMVALARWRGGDDYDADNMNATVVLAPTGMAAVGSLVLGVPGLFVAVLMGGLAAGIWYAVARPLAPYEDEEEPAPAPASAPAQQQPYQAPLPQQDWQDYGRRAEPELPPQMPGQMPRQMSPRRSGLGDLVAEYRAGEQGEVDYAARMQPGTDGFGGPPPGAPPGPDVFGGPMTGTMMPADRFGGGTPEYGMPAPAPAPEYNMPATGVLYPGAAPMGGPTGAPKAASAKPSPNIYGLLTVFTLMDGAGDAFDKLAEETVEAVQLNEPDTLVFVCHGVKSAPLQRIVYELYRDEVAFSEHQRQPHMERFATERQTLVLATNVIELSVNAAKVVPLPSAFRL